MKKAIYNWGRAVLLYGDPSMNIALLTLAYTNLIFGFVLFFKGRSFYWVNFVSAAIVIVNSSYFWATVFPKKTLDEINSNK